MAQLSRRMLLGSTAAAAAAAYLPRSAVAGPLANRSGLAWNSGVRDSSPPTFAAWRGCALDLTLNYSPRDSWASIRDKTGSTAKWAIGTRPEALALSYPLFPKNHSPKTHGVDMWRRAAAGEFDTYHAGAANSLASFAQQLVMRIGWEWSHNGHPWSCNDVALAPSYKAYFARVSSIFRSRVPNVLIDWCSSKEGKCNDDVRKWYPGGEHVDIVGVDFYDMWPPLTTQARWDGFYWKTRHGGPVGPGHWLEFARSQGKPLSFPEWGLVDTAHNGGGDNPLFIQNMVNFFRANAEDIAYEAYFNRDTYAMQHRLDETYPNASAEYKRQMAL